MNKFLVEDGCQGQSTNPDVASFAHLPSHVHDAIVSENGFRPRRKFVWQNSRHYHSTDDLGDLGCGKSPHDAERGENALSYVYPLTFITDRDRTVVVFWALWNRWMMVHRGPFISKPETYGTYEGRVVLEIDVVRFALIKY